MTTFEPDLTVLIAVKNEGKHLASTLEGLCAQLESGVVFETLVIDGMSSDDTVQIVDSFKHKLPGLRCLSNPKIMAASGWNLGLREALSPKVAILSGHARLPPNYFKTLLAALTPSIVGVGGLAIPVGTDATSSVIAQAFSSRLGNGGASFMQAGKAGPVETIAFGSYWKQALLDIGGFDERIVRGQDWDLNLRLRAAGFNLWLEPSVCVYYTTRSDFASLWRRQYLAGYWKYFIHKKNKAPLLLRHWIPGVFTASLFIPLWGLLWHFEFMAIPVFVLLTHMMVVTWEYHQIKNSNKDWLLFWWAIFVIHFAYGLGLFWGRFKQPQVVRENLTKRL